MGDSTKLEVVSAQAEAYATAESHLAGVKLYPGGEGVPGCGFGDGDADLLDKDEEGAGPEGGTMNLARRPEVVGDEKKYENF